MIPDFDQIARRLFALLDLRAEDENTISAQVNVAAEQLRLVWNARGAADIAKLETEMMGDETADWVRELIDREIRTLDR
jgi:hypothetical protein